MPDASRASGVSSTDSRSIKLRLDGLPGSVACFAGRLRACTFCSAQTVPHKSTKTMTMCIHHRHTRNYLRSTPRFVQNSKQRQSTVQLRSTLDISRRKFQNYTLKPMSAMPSETAANRFKPVLFDVINLPGAAPSHPASHPRSSGSSGPHTHTHRQLESPAVRVLGLPAM